MTDLSFQPAPLPRPAGDDRYAERLLEVDELRVEFRSRDAAVTVVDGVTFHLDPGETLAVLGESGSGKSVTAHAIMGILDSPPARVCGGAIRYRGTNLLTLDEERRRQIRGREIAMIFQDSLSALNPVFPVGWQIGEALRHRQGMSRDAARRRAVELMDLVRIPAAAQRVGDYPHQFSGGMRQRVMIATALALQPKVLIADEPTTALDVTVQAQIMDLLAELRRELDMAMILITHDLGVVADVADRIAVMYAGRVVESADVHALYAAPAHPYTEGLLASIPRVDRRGRGLVTITGQPPSPARIPSGCAFHPRCPYARQVCAEVTPAPQRVGGGRLSACHFATEVRDGRLA
ncbi:MAG TPA: ABC transporter ATP-binding protein [Asanoa sp.]